MCTAITLETRDGLHALGRNLDVTSVLDAAVILLPREYEVLNIITHEKEVNEYAILGMATEFKKHVVFADGMNEMGLCCAVLDLPKYASWNEGLVEGKANVAPYDFVYWILAHFKSISEVKEALKKVNLVNPLIDHYRISADVHWIAMDCTGESIVIEKTKGKFRIYQNKIGVLTNAPTFDWHLINLNRYLKVESMNPSDVQWGHQVLEADSQGFGGIGLPGDSSSPSRFVKAAFLRNHVVLDAGEEALISEVFHVLGNVSVVKGTALTPEKQYLMTQYTSCMCLETGTYYYNTYNNNQINAICFGNEDLNNNQIKKFLYRDKLMIQVQTQ